MDILWTPHILPPNATDLSELSFSAWKVLLVIEEQDNEKLRRKSLPNCNLFKREITDENRSITVNCVKKKLNERLLDENKPPVANRRFNFLESSLTSSNKQDQFLTEPNCCTEGNLFNTELDKNKLQSSPLLSTQLFINPLNESVDMFDDTPVINLGAEMSPNLGLIQYQKEELGTIKQLQYSTGKTKITNYFPSTKCKVIRSGDPGNSLPKLVPNLNEGDNEMRLCGKTSSIGLGNMHNLGNLENTPKEYILPKLTNSYNQTKKIGFFTFENLSKNVMEATKCLKSPLTSESSNGMLMRSLLSDNLNIGQHDESTFKACSYFNETQTDYQESSQREHFKNSEMSIIKLSTDNQEEIFGHFTRNSITEVGMTLCYREGFCLLNRRNRINCVPNGILFCPKFLDGSFKIIFFSSECFKDISLLNIILHLLSSFTRKICFEAQSMIIYILDNIPSVDKRVCYDWCILDPLVGAWLLDPDHPPTSLQDFLKEPSQLKVLESNDYMTVCGSLLLSQSQIMENLYSKLINENLWNLFLYLETQIIPILAVMEMSEILMDTQKLKITSNILSERLTNLESEAELIVGHKLVLNSSTQVRKVLYDELKLDKAVNVTIKGTSIRGVKSTSESMAGFTKFYTSKLKLLVKAHPLPSLILEYRQLFKLKSAYTDALFEYANKRGSISSMWDLCSAATGRITSSNPNLQAVPKQSIQVKTTKGIVEINLRSCFLAREGHILISADFQHIELRILAILAQDKDLLSLFRKKDDIFCAMTQLRLNKHKITQEERNQTKTLVYALMYGAGIKKIAGILSLSAMEAKNIRDTFLSIFPGLSDFSEKILNEVRQTKILKSISGRKRIFPNILSFNDAQRKYSERQAINFVIQGSASDICKGALLRSELELKKANLKSKLLLQIHDELVWEVQEHEEQVFKDLILKTMEANRSYWANKMKIDIPLPVAIITGKAWGTMK